MHGPGNIECYNTLHYRNFGVTRTAGRLPLFYCAQCWDLHISVQCISINSRLLFIICKEGAGNIVLRVAETHHLLSNALLIVHRGHVSSTSPQVVTSTSCQAKNRIRLSKNGKVVTEIKSYLVIDSAHTRFCESFFLNLVWDRKHRRWTPTCKTFAWRCCTEHSIILLVCLFVKNRIGDIYRKYKSLSGRI
jgi:hypothetical protein